MSLGNFIRFKEKLRGLRNSIRAKSAPPQLPRSLVTAIESTMTNTFDCPAHIRNLLHLSDVRSFHKTRTFWKADVEFERPVPVGDGPELQRRIAVMIKCSRSRRSTEVDRYLSGRKLPVPDFFGTAEVKKLSAALWQFHSGRSAGTFARYTAEELDRLVHAIALISATTRDIADEVRLPAGVRWVKPLTDQLQKFHAATHQLSEFKSELVFLGRIEEEAIRTLHSFGPPILNHNDLRAPNIILTDDGGIRIVDWENASLGPPGASLHKFAGSNPEVERTVATLYVKYMSEYGIDLDVDDVIYVMRGQQVFWYLERGLRLNDIGRITAGLRLVRSAFSKQDAGRREYRPRKTVSKAAP